MDLFFSVMSRYSWCKVIFVEYTEENMVFPFISSAWKKLTYLVAKKSLCGGGIMLSTFTPVHAFIADTVNAYHYRDEVFDAYMRLFRGFLSPEFILSTKMRRHVKLTLLVIFLEKKISDFNPFEHIWGDLEKTSVQHNSSLRTHKVIKVAFSR